MNKLLDAWMALLDGVISVPVYRIDVSENETGNYVVLRPEGGTGQNDKRSINDEVVIITDVVTIFENNANGSTADGIDKEIFDIMMPNPKSNVLSITGYQVLNLRRENFDYLQEQDNTKSYYRKVSRYSMRLHETS